MSNKVKDIAIKNRIYYLFNDIININNLDQNNIKIDEKSCKDILNYYIGYVTIKDLKYAKSNTVNPLYLIFNKMNRYIEEINENQFSTLIPIDESKEKRKKIWRTWSKIRNLISLVTKNSDDFDDKYIKIKFNSDDNLPLNKAIKLPRMIIVAQTIFLKNGKYYPQHFCDKCLYQW